MEKTINEFVRMLASLYLEKRDMDQVIKHFDEHISWIGTGENEIVVNLVEAKKALELEKNEFKNGFRIINESFHYETINDTYIVYGEFLADPKDNKSDVENLQLRFSAVCIKYEEGFKLLHVHMSHADQNLEENKFYVTKNDRVDNQTLRLKVKETLTNLNESEQQLKILTHNIPGGVSEVLNDDTFTIIQLSEGFLNMFGYSLEEVKTIFHNHYINIIHPDDQKRVNSFIKKKSDFDDIIEVEYRVRCKDGKIIWMLDRGRLINNASGNQSFFSILLDISERKEEEEKNRLMLQRHQVIMDQASDIVFEWDIDKDTLEYSSNWKKQFGYDPIRTNISNIIPLSNHIHKDDLTHYDKIKNDVLKGKEYSEADFRICDQSLLFKWYRIRVTTQFNAEHKPIKGIGIIINIDRQKLRTAALINAAQRDPLTNLYNKKIAKSKIEEILVNYKDQNHAFLIIDIDDFKEVNDNFGHQGGDAVLMLMAKRLEDIFNEDNIVGRIGGDEFLVFMPNINDLEIISKKAKQIVSIFKDNSEDFKDLSCSVGISLAYQDGPDYSSLLRCSDSALYYIKNNGKNDYSFYKSFMGIGVPYSIMRTLINQENPNNELESSLVKYALYLFYNKNNIIDSIHKVLKAIGLAYEVSRVYIFENSSDNKYCSNTFEWYSEDNKSVMNQLQNLSYEQDLKGFLDLFDDNDIFYCQNIEPLESNVYNLLNKQGVTSLLQCLIRDNHVFKGFIGFDEIHENRYWTTEQIKTLRLLTNIIYTFLSKQRLIEDLARLKNQH
ncbi:MAG: diguanylate cyclase [Erysipelotrichaceae bacterium]